MRSLGITLIALSVLSIVACRVCRFAYRNAQERAAAAWSYSAVYDEKGKHRIAEEYRSDAAEADDRAAMLEPYAFSFLPPLAPTEIFVYAVGIAGAFALAVASSPRRQARRSSEGLGTEIGRTSPIQEGFRAGIRAGIREGLTGGSDGNAMRPRSHKTAMLLCLFLGALGAHRFYVGRTGSGILQCLTMGGLGFWCLLDLIRIADGNFRDGSGRRLVKA